MNLTFRGLYSHSQLLHVIFTFLRRVGSNTERIRRLWNITYTRVAEFRNVCKRNLLSVSQQIRTVELIKNLFPEYCIKPTNLVDRVTAYYYSLNPICHRSSHVPGNRIGIFIRPTLFWFTFIACLSSGEIIHREILARRAVINHVLALLSWWYHYWIVLSGANFTITNRTFLKLNLEIAMDLTEISLRYTATSNSVFRASDKRGRLYRKHFINIQPV